VAYDCVVCVKQVPDTAHVSAEAMTPEGTVNRAALPAIFNPEDLYALEMALSVREKYGGSVTVLSMGPPKAADVLREALYRGADRAILLTDKRAAASDTLATSYIINQAIRTLGKYDIVFCGRQAIDGDTAQVGPQTAEKLGIPQVTYLERIESAADGMARIRRNVGNGWEVVEVKLPVLVTVLDAANEPRPPAAKRVMKQKRAHTRLELAADVEAEMSGASEEKREAEVERRAEKLRSQGLLIDTWNLDDIDADLSWCGLNGSPTKVHRVQSIVLTKEGYTEIPPTEEGVRRLVRELIIDHTFG
jgi:electron transfer flavoprotein beta subunit